MDIKFDANGLVPAIAQDIRTGRVLMLAYMNREALDQTLATGKATYYSRSRQQLWVKGETSGHTQKVIELQADCDGDAVLLLVEQQGVACHTGEYSCFHNPLQEGKGLAGSHILYALEEVIRDRKAQPVEGSYTNYLFDKGVDKICKKVGEEAAEVIIAAKNHSAEELRYEAADLIYHLLVLLAEQGMEVDEVFDELNGRR